MGTHDPEPDPDTAKPDAVIVIPPDTLAAIQPKGSDRVFVITDIPPLPAREPDPETPENT